MICLTNEQYNQQTFSYCIVSRLSSICTVAYSSFPTRRFLKSNQPRRRKQNNMNMNIIFLTSAVSDFTKPTFLHFHAIFWEYGKPWRKILLWFQNIHESRTQPRSFPFEGVLSHFLICVPGVSCAARKSCADSYTTCVEWSSKSPSSYNICAEWNEVHQ